MLTKCKSILFLRYCSLAICMVFMLSPIKNYAQEFHFTGNQKRISVSFKLIKNLIVIPVYVNGKGPYDFVLDTGVGPMIITEPSIIDSVDFTVMRKIKVSGLGLETVEAFVTQNVNAKISSSKIEHIPTAILKEDFFNLSGHLGTKIYGLIGFSFFNSFVVDIRYTTNRIFLSHPDSDVKYKGSKIPISIENMKAYVYADIEVPDSGVIQAKFLIDTGASHALSMEMLNGGMFPQPFSKIKASLGMSLSGQIKGYLGRIKQFSIGDYDFKDVVSGFPDYHVIADKIDLKSRNGNLGAELLKKFNIQLNYRDGFMYVKPNSFYKTPFEHNMVGMVVYLDQKNYNRFFIAEVDENSPAEKSGICPNDEIIGVNFKSMDSYTLNDLDLLFKSGTNKSVILEIFRDNKTMFKIVHLERRI